VTSFNVNSVVCRYRYDHSRGTVLLPLTLDGSVKLFATKSSIPHIACL
jgi:hypothetical protein